LRRGAAIAGARPELVRRAEAILLYEAYEQRLATEVRRVRGEGGDFPLPADLDYRALPGLRRECAERLAAVRPTTTSQASRIPGVTPAALATVWAHARLHAGASRRGDDSSVGVALE
ncbi:MAG TPA: hypothetical protein VFG69_20575, partial [Nannocystaceae bacterium]|nr:hypothetical protein [Nannocystaceae bacterium]